MVWTFPEPSRCTGIIIKDPSGVIRDTFNVVTLRPPPLVRWPSLNLILSLILILFFFNIIMPLKLIRDEICLSLLLCSRRQVENGSDLGAGIDLSLDPLSCGAVGTNRTLG